MNHLFLFKDKTSKYHHTGFLFNFGEKWFKIEFGIDLPTKGKGNSFLITQIKNSSEQIQTYIPLEFDQQKKIELTYSCSFEKINALFEIFSPKKKYNLFAYNCRDYCLDVITEIRKSGIEINEKSITSLKMTKNSDFISIPLRFLSHSINPTMICLTIFIVLIFIFKMYKFQL